MPELVSVIVPVYNVSEYIELFFKSIQNQTYTNIEVILWDDGSTDDSLQLCLKQTSLDKRFITHHSENCGVALARKYAVEHARGKYITFADPDDYLDSHYIEYLLQSLQSNKADMSACQCAECDSDSTTLQSNEKSISTALVINREKSMEKLLNRDFDKTTFPLRSELWGKLYKRSLFENIDYPVQRTCSDVMLLSNIMDRISNTAIIENKLYYYRVSRTHSLQTKQSISKIKDIWNSHLYIINNFKHNEHLNEYYYTMDTYCTIFHIFTNILQWDDKSDNSLKAIYRHYQRILVQLPIPTNAPRSVRIKRLIYRLPFVLVQQIFHLYKKSK